MITAHFNLYRFTELPLGVRNRIVKKAVNAPPKCTCPSTVCTCLPRRPAFTTEEEARTYYSKSTQRYLLNGTPLTKDEVEKYLRWSSLVEDKTK